MSWNGLTNWKDVASPNLYMHLTGTALQQHAENPEEQRKLHLRSVAQAFSSIENSTASLMPWQRTFRTCQYQWAHSMLKGAILRAPAWTWQRKITYSEKAFCIYLCLPLKAYKMEGIKNGRHLVSFRIAISLPESLQNWQDETFTYFSRNIPVWEAGTTPCSLTTSPPIPGLRRDHFLCMGKTKVFK